MRGEKTGKIGSVRDARAATTVPAMCPTAVEAPRVMTTSVARLKHEHDIWSLWQRCDCLVRIERDGRMAKGGSSIWHQMTTTYGVFRLHKQQRDAGVAAAD